jgi:phosphonatase-like hydrolase
MGPIQLVVFDLAGTTVDDRGMVLECFVETVRAYDLPSTPDELNDLMGLNKREVLGMLAGRRYSPGSPEAEQLADKSLAYFIEQMSAAYDRHLAPIPGAEETFAFLHARNIKIATDTGFDATIGGLIMERLKWPGRLIDMAITSSEVPRGRPAPYMIFHTMEHLGILDVHQVMKVGDSPADLEEGFNAGCGEVVGVLSGAHTATTLRTYYHTHLIESVADLPALFT